MLKNKNCSSHSRFNDYLPRNLCDMTITMNRWKCQSRPVIWNILRGNHIFPNDMPSINCLSILESARLPKLTDFRNKLNSNHPWWLDGNGKNFPGKIAHERRYLLFFSWKARKLKNVYYQSIRKASEDWLPNWLLVARWWWWRCWWGGGRRRLTLVHWQGCTTRVSVWKLLGMAWWA